MLKRALAFSELNILFTNHNFSFDFQQFNGRGYFYRVANVKYY